MSGQALADRGRAPRTPLRIARVVVERQGYIWRGTLRDFLYLHDYSHSERRELIARMKRDARDWRPTFEGSLTIQVQR